MPHPYLRSHERPTVLCESPLGCRQTWSHGTSGRPQVLKFQWHPMQHQNWVGSPPSSLLHSCGAPEAPHQVRPHWSSSPKSASDSITSSSHQLVLSSPLFIWTQHFPVVTGLLNFFLSEPVISNLFSSSISCPMSPHGSILFKMNHARFFLAFRCHDEDGFQLLKTLLLKVPVTGDLLFQRERKSVTLQVLCPHVYPQHYSSSLLCFCI